LSALVIASKETQLVQKEM